MKLNPEQIRRALYIDFEGTKTEPASFLGTFCEDEWTVSILEPALWSAAGIQHKLGSVAPVDRIEACRSLMNRAIEESRAVVAWSTREVTEILSYGTWGREEGAWWEANLFNALPPAKAWARRKNIEVPIIAGTFGGRDNKWSLSGFRQATDYPAISGLFEPGKTASRIRNVRDQIARHGDFSRITPTAKRKWTNVLIHNYHDCAGLAHVVRVVGESDLRMD